jgi:hypothetical protein
MGMVFWISPMTTGKVCRERDAVALAEASRPAIHHRRLGIDLKFYLDVAQFTVSSVNPTRKGAGAELVCLLFVVTVSTLSSVQIARVEPAANSLISAQLAKRITSELETDQRSCLAPANCSAQRFSCPAKLPVTVEGQIYQRGKPMSITFLNVSFLDAGFEKNGGFSARTQNIKKRSLIQLNQMNS